jgi:alkylated DNA repair dioxygenase AlkB
LTAPFVRPDLPGAELRLYPGAFPAGDADRHFRALHGGLDWQAREITLFGRRVASPRLSAWYGDAAYTYSGLTWPARRMPVILAEIADTVAALAGGTFNTVLANLYRDGADSMGWHADDEPELGPDPVIASVVFGAERRFVFRDKGDTSRKHDVPLRHGDVLIMGADTQARWQHAVPKTARPVGARINLTFRRIAADAAPTHEPS